MRLPYSVAVLTCLLFADSCHSLRLMQHLRIINHHDVESSNNFKITKNNNVQEKNFDSVNYVKEIKTEKPKFSPKEQSPINNLKNDRGIVNIQNPRTHTVKEGPDINSKLNTIIQKTNFIKKPQDENNKRPMSYSEMKGAFLKNNKNNNNTKDQRKNVNINIKMLDKRSSAKPVDQVTENIHAKLHRTNRKESIRSIIYPQTNPRKYSLLSTTARLDSFFNIRSIPRSKGKYDIRHLDVEKLMDIVVPDAAALVYKYIRDLPSVPLIYECKTGIIFPLVKILGGFNQINNAYGGSITDIDSRRRSDWITYLFIMLFRWLLGINPPKNTIKGLARSVEHDLTMFALELPNMVDKDCEGDMDQADQEQFNFDYNYLMNLEQLAKMRKSRRNRVTKTQLKKGTQS